MTNEAKTDAVAVLIDKAAKAHESGDAIRFSQAACNVANAIYAAENAKATFAKA